MLGSNLKNPVQFNLFSLNVHQSKGCMQAFLYNYIDKSNPRALCDISITSSRSWFRGLKIWGGISQFCADNIGFPTMAASFEQRND